MIFAFRRLFLVLLTLVFVAPTAKAEDPWFLTSTLNGGLTAPPDAVDRRTPRTALESFLRAADRNDWQAAAHLLDLTDIDAAAQADAGADLAEKLYSIIDRKAVLDWSTLLQRPDALQTTGGQSARQAGEPRRSLLLRDLDLDPVPAAIRLNRVKPGEDATPVWIFARETVADIDALYQAYGPSDLERQLPGSLRQDAFWGLMWWEILGLPLLIGAAGLLGWGIRRALNLIGRFATSTAVGTKIMHAISTPVTIAAITWLIAYVSTEIFVFSGQIDVFLEPVVAMGFVVALLMFIVNVIEALLDTLIAPGSDVDLTDPARAESRELATKLNAGKRVLVIVVTLIGAGVVLSTADIFRSIGLSLLASAGALTLVLGFAARNVLGNVMASLQIALNQSARVGDRIIFGDELCHVERINMTYVQLRHWDGTRVIVPVEEFISRTFQNWSLVEPEMLRVLKFKLDPRTDVDALRDAFVEIATEAAEGDLKGKLGDLSNLGVNVAGQDVFGIDVWFNLPCADANTSFEAACVVRERLVARAAEIADRNDTPVFPEGVAAEAA